MANVLVYHPDPVNQFYRLDKDTPTGPWVKTTRWNNWITDSRGNRINADSINCFAAEGAVMIDAHTTGGIRTSPAGIRNYQDDMDGGIGIDDVDTAFHRHFGKDVLTPDSINYSELCETVRRERRHAGFGVDYRRVPDTWAAQYPGNFDHAIGLDYVYDDGTGLFYDSLRTKPFRAPLSAFRAGADGLAIRERGSSASLFVGFTAIRPILATTTYHIFLPEAGFFIYDATGYRAGVGGGRITSKRTSYTRGGGNWVPCTVIPRYTTDGGSLYTDRKLVRITKGIYVDRFMSASYAEAA